MARFNVTDIPKGEFNVMEIANRFYADCVKSDSEGRVFNRALPAVYRKLRNTTGILEVDKNGQFYNAL